MSSYSSYFQVPPGRTFERPCSRCSTTQKTNNWGITSEGTRWIGGVQRDALAMNPNGLQKPIVWAAGAYGGGHHVALWQRSALGAFATQVEARRRARNALRFIPGILL